MIIRQAMIKDAGFLATVVTEAIGKELCLGLAGGESRVPLVMDLFTRLASDPVSQYSYKNSLLATTDEGSPAGGIIAYDGAHLHTLRRAFIREANEILGWDVSEEEAESWGDEADAGEIYIDSLYVIPDFQGHGVASALLKGIEKKFVESHKPLGLLVEPENMHAFDVYRHWGFKSVGISNFFQTPMIHMQKHVSEI